MKNQDATLTLAQLFIGPTVARGTVKQFVKTSIPPNPGTNPPRSGSGKAAVEVIETLGREHLEQGAVVAGVNLEQTVDRHDRRNEFTIGGNYSIPWTRENESPKMLLHKGLVPDHSTSIPPWLSAAFKRSPAIHILC